MTDEVVLAELGKRVNSIRLEQNLTQAELAREAGLAKRTIERLESGDPVALSALLRVARVLRLLDRLDEFIPEPGPAPMDLLARQGHRKQRASQSKNPAKSAPARPWIWGEDKR
jgi:transcriptional regulator with XRE-family HTH domain